MAFRTLRRRGLCQTLFGRALPLLAFLCAAAPAGAVSVASPEPSVAVAKTWWPEQYNVWTPLGWPDHYFKFAVLYNGTVLSVPATPERYHPHSHQWAGEDFQLTFCSSADGRPYKLPETPGRSNLREWDGGLGIQSWDFSHAAPLLQTQWRSKDGVVVRASMFAHLEGAGPVETALEAHYLRIRLEVIYVDEYYHPETWSVSAMLTQACLGHKDFHKIAPEISVMPAKAVFPKALTMAPAASGNGKDYVLTLPDGLVRLGVKAGDGDGPRISLSGEAGGRYDLCLTFPAKVGETAELILPSLPQKPDVFAREAALGFEDALAESDAFWTTQRPSGEAVFDVPEEDINRMVEANLRYTPVISEKDYRTGEYSYLSGTWCYDALWATPASMVFGMFLDPMGRFDLTERYTDIYARYQGTEVAKGPSYQLHPGFFSVPPHVESVDWMSDHGAIMYQVATHGLISGDKPFIDKWTEPLVKACDFIVDNSLAEHPGIPGLLPAAWASDEEVPLQAVWNIAWCYKGMTETVRLLERIGHPRAAEFQRFLVAYKERFQKAYRQICAEGPKWTDEKGQVRFRPPAELVPPETGSRHQAAGRAAGHTSMTDAFYLDTGPLCLVWAGLMEADDPIMQDVAAFFREGPNWHLRKPLPWSLDRPVLEHEMSSCEPCYSFNVFHSWKLGDRQRYLEGMYSLLVGSTSQNTYISCEHRSGIQGTQFSFPLGFHLARLAVIDDRIEPGSLHLLRFCPLAWLDSSRPARFQGIATELGRVNLQLQLSQDGKTLLVDFALAPGQPAATLRAPERVILHIPPVPGLKTVRINGRNHLARKDIELTF